MTNETFYQLAKAVQQSFKAPQAYGRIRTKLNKQGFSEILLYKAVANHCEENFIDPSTMIDEMKELLDGCSRSMNFLSTSNTFPFLRGQFHNLRLGQLDRDEPKAPEQKGKFICNQCFNIKDKAERNTNKNSPNTCLVCAKAMSKAHAEKVKQAVIAKRERYETRNKAKEAGEATPFEQGITAPNERVLSSKPVPEQIAPVVEEVALEVDTAPITVTHEVMDMEPVIQLTEVMADQHGATITLNCSTNDLHKVLSALSHLTK